MKAGSMIRVAGITGVLALAGCAGDVAREIGTNAQVRDRVMAAITANGNLAEEMTRRLIARIHCARA